MRRKEYDINSMADNIGKYANIIPLEKMKGKIVGVYVDEGEPQYQVAYFINGDRKTCYFTMDEIQYL